MSRPQTVFTRRDIARMLQVGDTFVKDALRAGDLKSFRAVSEHGHRPKYFVHRHELVRWLLTGRFELGHLRAMLNRADDADVILVRTRPGLQTALMRRGERAIRADGMFDLGRMLGEWRTWAVVIDLCEVGALEATRSLAELSKRPDRPELIGLYDDEYSPRPETAEVFDLLLPLSRGDAALAAGVSGLKP